MQPRDHPSCAAAAMTLQLREDVSTRLDELPSQAAMLGPPADPTLPVRNQGLTSEVFILHFSTGCSMPERCQTHGVQAGTAFSTSSSLRTSQIAA